MTIEAFKIDRNNQSKKYNFFPIEKNQSSPEDYLKGGQNVKKQFHKY